MALGGVATGSMKAHELAMVTGNISSRGSIPNCMVKAATTGSIVVATAVLEVSSVKKAMERVRINNITHRGI